MLYIVCVVFPFVARVPEKKQNETLSVSNRLYLHRILSAINLHNTKRSKFSRINNMNLETDHKWLAIMHFYTTQFGLPTRSHAPAVRPSDLLQTNLAALYKYYYYYYYYETENV